MIIASIINSGLGDGIMPYYYLVCADCDYEFSIPADQDPYNQVCPQCSSKNICRRFGVKNSICIDQLKECSNCPFNNNCTEQPEDFE
jgi:DNA-directed RNA polymerase subunit RPC12/RpoP